MAGLGPVAHGQSAPAQPRSDAGSAPATFNPTRQVAPGQASPDQVAPGRAVPGQGIPGQGMPGQYGRRAEQPGRMSTESALPTRSASPFGPTSLVPPGGTGSTPTEVGTPAGQLSVERLAMDSPTRAVNRGPVAYRSIGSSSGMRAAVATPPVAPPVAPPRRELPESVDLFQPARVGEVDAPEVPSTPETDQPSKAGRHHRPRADAPEDSRPPTAPTSTGGKRAKGGRRRRPTFWRELPMLVVVALLLTFLIQTFLARVYEIPSGSMETTLHGCTGCTNDRVLVDKLSFRFGDPAPGDVIVFRGPTSWEDGEQLAVPSSNPLIRGLQSVGSLIGLAPPDEKDLIKRVIAVGGQTVACCDAQNRITVDGKPLNEPYIYYLPEAGPPVQSEFGPVKVPDGQLWVMGDSRNNSADSRVPGHGPIPVDNVIGKARFVVLPFSRIKSIEDTNPQRVALSMPSGAPPGAPLALGVIGAVPLTAGRRWWLRRRGRQRRRTGRDTVG
jgi:signal peptidase I